MIAQKRLRISLLAGFFLALIVALLPGRSVTASGAELMARWDIQADFTGYEPNVVLVVEIGAIDANGDWHQEAEKSIPLTCFDENVDWTSKGQPAYFTGEDSLVACQMVSIVDAATDLAGGESDWVTESGGAGTTIDATVSLAGYGQDNPLFYHPDIAFEARNSGESRLTMAVGGLESRSEWFLPESGQHFHGAFLAEGGDYGIHFPRFAVEGEELDATPEVVNGPALVSHTYDGWIYFGYSPDTGSSFQGEIYQIDVDPGCAGVG